MNSDTDALMDEPIRLPDEVYEERLIDGNTVFVSSREQQYQRDLERVLTQSLVENMHYVDDENALIIALQSSNEEYEKEMEKYVEEYIQIDRERRAQRFVNAKIQLTRLSHFDKQNETHYTKLLQCIHNYEEGCIECASYSDEIEYMHVLGLIKTMRLSKDERNDLCGFMCVLSN